MNNRKLLYMTVFAVAIGPLMNIHSAEFSEVLKLSLDPPGKEVPGKFESEHAPYPKRKYWLNQSPAPFAKGFILHPDDSSEELKLQSVEEGSMVNFDSPWKSKSMHGPNSVYVFDQQISGNTLYTRTAKWIVIHHNCSWGHGYRFDEERLTPDGLNNIPLEIVPEALWDGNFHVSTETGMTLKLRVLSYGVPVGDASVIVTTDRGWQKEIRTDSNGMAHFQLIRDYYSDKWVNFDRKQTGSLLFVARLRKQGSGKFKGKFYNNEILTTSLPWRYRPARADYTSLVSGLGIGFITILISLVAVLFYRERRKRPARRLGFNE